MQIISNNCCAGYLYQLLGEKYSNPFVWGSLDFEEFEKIYLNRKKLEFFPYNARIVPEKSNIIHLETSIYKINYTHFLENPEYKTPTIVRFGHGRDIVCRNIIKRYLRRTYKSRALRYSTDDEFVFILDAAAMGGRRGRRTITREEAEKFLNWDIPKTGVRLILITKDKDLVSNSDNKIVITTSTGVDKKNADIIMERVKFK